MVKIVSGMKTKPLNILLVEDDDGDVKAVERAFTKAKIVNPIIRAVDGVEALEILRGQNDKKIQKPYIMLIDLNLPRMTGLDLMRVIRNDPEFKESVIFVLTTSKNQADKDAAYELHAAGYIHKETAGDDFLNLTELVDTYWRLVELPE